MGRKSKYPTEVRERAVRLVYDQQGQHGSQWAPAMRARLGMAAEGEELLDDLVGDDAATDDAFDAFSDDGAGSRPSGFRRDTILEAWDDADDGPNGGKLCRDVRH